MPKESVSKKNKEKTPWYIAGLHFECQQCGNCCCGPDEGYIWVTKPEIDFIAEFLNVTVAQFTQKFLRTVNFRKSITEHPITKDCILLDCAGGEKKCKIYPVRPNQCRNWPFWSTNLQTPNDWNCAAERCPGINRGRLHTHKEIIKLKNKKHWWKNDTQS